MNCSFCGNQVEDITKGCSTCGNYANSSINYCYNCGRENSEGYKICAGCKTPLVAKQNSLVALALSLFLFFPFLAFYVGRKKEALFRTAIFVLGVLAFNVGFEEAKINESLSLITGTIAILCWAFLFLWSCIDLIKLVTKWPKPYTNGQGQIIF